MCGYDCKAKYPLFHFQLPARVDAARTSSDSYIYRIVKVCFVIVCLPLFFASCMTHPYIIHTNAFYEINEQTNR